MRLYLGAAVGAGRAEALLAEEPCRLLARGTGATLDEALRPCLDLLGSRTFTPLVAAAAPEPPGVPDSCRCQAGALEAPSGGDPTGADEADPTTSGLPRVDLDEALMAGALGGRPGLVLHGAERTRVLAADRTGRLHRVPADRIRSAEAGTGALLARVRTLMDDEAHPSSQRLRRALQRRDLLSALLQEAEFPGPDPHLRGLILSTVRRLVALVREARCRIPGNDRVEGTWTGPLMREPVLDLFQQEVYRYAPEIRWRPPLLGAAAGALLLARAGASRPADRLRMLFRQGPAKLRPWLAALAERED